MTHFGPTSEMLDQRPFKEDREDITSDPPFFDQNENNEIKKVDMFVLKQKCLGMGKRLTWHRERIHNVSFNPHTILENLENISYPV